VPLSARASPCTPDFDEEDAEAALLAARSRRGVRLYPFNPHSKSIIDQVVFGHELDVDEKFDSRHFHAMFQDSAGRPSWKGQLRGKQLGPRKENEPWGPIEDPRTMPIVPGGRRKFAEAPVTKSIVDSIIFGHDIDMSGGDRERFESMQAMHEGSAGAHSFVRPHGPSSPRTVQVRRRHTRLRQKAKQLTARLYTAPQAVEKPKAPLATPRHPARACALPLAVAKAVAMLDEKCAGRRAAWT